MLTFLILAPYGAFTLLMLVTSPAVSLLAAAAMALAVIAYDVIGGRSIKMLGAGSAILFACLGCYLLLVDSSWTNLAVKLTVDAGILTISLASLAIRFPFTLQYAREVNDARTAAMPGFVRANYIITGAWTVAFVLMLLANVLIIYVPGLPLWSGLAIAFAARNTALYFTRWYPEHQRSKFAALAASATAH